jgi:DNA (cytosine-5)-methyltransferase 1
MTFRYVDVCAGYSAASVAFRGFGWEPAAYAEIDPFAAAIIAHHHGGTAPLRMPDPDGPIIGLEPKDEAKERKRRAVAIKSIPNYHWGDRIPNYGDFTTIQEDDVGPVQLLIGGTPCQSFSQAGKRMGLDDPRGNLTLEFLALARRLRPRWLAWENVFGFLSHDEGRTPGTFFRILGELGYGWAYRVLDAQFIRVDGLERAVPQRRRRVIVVGCLGNPTAAAAVLFERESLRGDPCPSRRTLEDVAGTLKSSAGKRGGIQDESGGSGLVAARMVAFGEYEIDGTASTLKARDWKDATDLVMQPDVAAPLRAGGEESGWRNDLDSGTFVPVPPAVSHTLSAERARSPCGDGTEGTLIPVVPFDTTQIRSPCNGSNPQIGDPCHALAAEGHPPAVAFKPSHNTRDKDGEPRVVAPPLTADTDKGDQDTVLLVREVSGPLTSQSPQGQAIAIRTAQTGANGDGISEEAAHTLDHHGGRSQAICVHADAIGRDGKAKADSPDAEGKMRKRDAGLGVSEDASFALTTGQPHAIAFQERGRPEGRAVEFQEDVAYSILSPSDGGRRSEMNICDGWRVRRLTAVECERLQGVPDRYTHIELKKRQRSAIDAELAAYWRGQAPDLTDQQLLYLCADSPRYRVLGNSYATNFIRWVGWGIKIVDEAVFG